MRKILSIISFSALITVSTVSCDKKLEIRPQGSVDKVTLQDAKGVDLLVTSAYASLTENGLGGTPNNWVFGSIYGGDANKGTDPGDQPAVNEFEVYTLLSNNGYLNEKWVFNYNGIKRVNHTINMINTVDGLDATLKVKRIGEMKFLRGLFYFELRRVFKMVPWVDEVLEAKENNPKVKNDVDILPNIEKDLTDAIAALPDKQDNIGRANKWAAKALLAKVYMFQGKFLVAAPLLREIIDNGMNAGGTKYTLVKKYSDNFDIGKENNSETVFAIQHSVDAADGHNANPGHFLNFPHNSGPGGCCGFYQPSYVFVNSFQVDAAGLPKLDGSYMNTIIPGSEISGASDANDADRTIPVDPRLDHSVGRRGIPYYDWGMPKTDWVRNPSNGGNYLPKKNVFKKTDTNTLKYDGWAPASSLNTDIIRFADVLLWYAEALTETGANTAAREYVNMVRARAANADDMVMSNGIPAANYKVGLYPASSFDTKENAMLAIRFERKLEFGMEGNRFFDLQRWGLAVTKTEIDFYIAKEKMYIQKFATAAAFAEYKMYFPIPNGQILSMGNAEDGTPYLKQNTNY